MPHKKIGRIEFFAKLEPLLSPRALEHTTMAYRLAKHGHKGQVRDGGEPYFEHPKSVAIILIDELKITDWQSICEALLHDTCEDTFILTWNGMQRIFGEVVTKDVRLLSKIPKEGYMQRINDHGSSRMWIVKLCDRLDNMRDVANCRKEKIEKYIKETRKLYVPLAERLITRLPKKHRWRGEYLKTELERHCDAAEVFLGDPQHLLVAERGSK